MTPLDDMETGRRLAESLVGRTITRALWFDNDPDHDYTGHEEAWLWLDDGRVISFGGYGYDAWGATIDEIEVVDVARCRHCGQPHQDRQLYDDEHGGAKYAYCVDGNHRAT